MNSYKLDWEKNNCKKGLSISWSFSVHVLIFRILLPFTRNVFHKHCTSFAPIDPTLSSISAYSEEQSLTHRSQAQRRASTADKSKTNTHTSSRSLTAASFFHRYSKYAKRMQGQTTDENTQNVSKPLRATVSTYHMKTHLTITYLILPLAILGRYCWPNRNTRWTFSTHRCQVSQERKLWTLALTSRQHHRCPKLAKVPLTIAVRCDIINTKTDYNQAPKVGKAISYL